MSWKVIVDEREEKWLKDIPADIKARIINIVDLLVEHGPQNVREPYVKHVKGKLFEIRSKGKVWYCKSILFYDRRSADCPTSRFH